MSIQLQLKIKRDSFKLALDMDLPDKGVTAFFGPSGCGKTSILRAVAGLDFHPGCVLTMGEQVWQSGNSFIPAHKRAVGYVSQQPELFPHLSVRKNLDYALKRSQAAHHRVTLDSAIQLLGLELLLNRMPEKLSGGEKQRACIARAIAANPNLLLMDEPMASLDIAMKPELMSYLESLCRELDIPMLFVSHSLDEVACLADYMVLIESDNLGSRVTATGAPSEMLTRMDLPFALDSGAESLIEATVMAFDDEFQLSYAEFPGGQFSLADRQLPLNSRVKLRIPARDVSLTLERQQGSSILNICEAVITDMVPGQGARMVVKLDASGCPLLASITRKSARLLELSPGKTVFAQIKSVALVQ